MSSPTLSNRKKAGATGGKRESKIAPTAGVAGAAQNRQNLRLILGLKLSQLRREQGLSLKELAGKAGLAISYLNEIEKGKKYPKPEKILALARALGTSFDSLVSLQLGGQLNTIEGILRSGILDDIPLDVFGVTSGSLLEMMSSAPERFSALIETVGTIARRFDVRLEHLLLAAMRSYVEQHRNYFEDLECAAEQFRSANDWAEGPAPDLGALRAHLVDERGYSIDETTIASNPELGNLRSVSIGGAKPRILLNPKLVPWQKAFLLAREIGCRELGIEEPISTSPYVKVESFQQLVNNFRASYFAGALLLDRSLLVADLKAFLENDRWNGAGLTTILAKYTSTPEMLFHRLSQILPKFFGLEQMYFHRIDHRRGTLAYSLGKELHYQRMPGTHSIGINEHHCRRWVSIQLLAELDRRHARGESPPALPGVQRSRFHKSSDEYFNIALAHPHSLEPDSSSCVTIGFVLSDSFKSAVRFWDDPSIPRVVVNDTCERCSLGDCAERAAPPSILSAMDRRHRQQAAVEALR